MMLLALLILLFSNYLLEGKHHDWQDDATSSKEHPSKWYLRKLDQMRKKKYKDFVKRNKKPKNICKPNALQAAQIRYKIKTNFRKQTRFRMKTKWKQLTMTICIYHLIKIKYISLTFSWLCFSRVECLLPFCLDFNVVCFLLNSVITNIFHANYK